MRPSADFPTTNCPPQTMPVKAANSAPIVVEFFRMSGMNVRLVPFISTMIEMELTTVLQALGDPVRLRILGALAESEEVACGAFNLGLAPSTMSHHLQVLRDAGLVAT